jgi:VWFA-related protein
MSGAALLGGSHALGQIAAPANNAPQEAGEITFSSSVKVVDVLATVRGKNNAIVRDLTKDDFILTEDGKPQVIKYFSQETDLPLTLGLMVDTSMSQQKVLEPELAASHRFVNQVLTDKDKLFLMQFDSGIVLRQRLTNSHKSLEDALLFVNVPSMGELERGIGLGTKLFDAVVQASNDILKTQENRKAMVLLTDGEDNNSDATVANAIEAAQRADTLIYSILFSDATFGGGGIGGRGKSWLERMSRETGGSFFEVSKKQSIDQIYQLMQDEIRSQYSLGFTSDHPVEISEFRKLKLTTKRKDLIVQTRERYWAKR